MAPLTFMCRSVAWAAQVGFLMNYRTAVRKVRWVAQAERLFALELGNEWVDANRPDLATVKCAALIISDRLARGARTGEVMAFRDRSGRVRVWFSADEKKLVGFAIEVRYEGAAEFADPLKRY